MLRALKLTACATVLLLAACDSDDTSSTDSGRLDARVDGAVPDGGQSDALTDAPQSDALLPCRLSVSAINGQDPATLTQIDSTIDRDINSDGVQIDVKVAVVGAPDGTTIKLNVTDLMPAPTAASNNGGATFNNVTVDPATTPLVQLRPVAPNCSTTPRSFNTQPDPTCVFAQPTLNQVLTTADDRLSGNDSFDYDIVVDTTEAQGGRVDLEVEGSSVGSVNPNPTTGQASFLGTALPPTADKLVDLKATVTVGPLTAECMVTVTVDTEGPTCELQTNTFDPAPIDMNHPTIAKGLGPDQDANPDDLDGTLQTTVVVATDGDEVTLRVNGVPQTVTPSDGQATFNLSLEDGDVQVQATCRDTNSDNSSTTSNSRALVDTAAPPAIDDLSCTVHNNRSGELRCSYTVPTDITSGVESCTVRYREDAEIASDDDYESNADGTQTLTAGAATNVTAVFNGLVMPHSYDFAAKCADYLGNTSPLSNLPDALTVFFKTDQLSGPAGSAMGLPIVAGDFNCDGLSDIAVGLFNQDNKGAVQLYFSNGAGFNDTPSVTINGTVDTALFGNGLAALQFDNDSGSPQPCTDLAVWARGVLGAARGNVFLYLGRSDWSTTAHTDFGTESSASADVIYKLGAGAGSNDRLGSADITMVNLDGDAHDDLVFNFSATDGTATVLVDYGETGISIVGVGEQAEAREMPAAADVQITGGTSAAGFGFAVGPGGHLNGDSYQELLIGAPGFRSGSDMVGAAYVVEGAQRAASLPEAPIDIDTSSRVHRVIGSASVGGLFGREVAGVGDLNGDGTPEFIVSAPSFDESPNNNIGRVWVFNFSPAPPTDLSDAKALLINDFANPAEDRLGDELGPGAAVHPILGSDLNNDGFADLAIGMLNTDDVAQGSVQIFLGKTGDLANLDLSEASPVLTPQGAGGTASFSRSIRFVRDINGDGYLDVAVGEPTFSSGAGRVLVFF